MRVLSPGTRSLQGSKYLFTETGYVSTLGGTALTRPQALALLHGVTVLNQTQGWLCPTLFKDGLWVLVDMHCIFLLELESCFPAAWGSCV